MAQVFQLGLKADVLQLVGRASLKENRDGLIAIVEL